MSFPETKTKVQSGCGCYLWYLYEGEKRTYALCVDCENDFEKVAKDFIPLIGLEDHQREVDRLNGLLEGANGIVNKLQERDIASSSKIEDLERELDLKKVEINEWDASLAACQRISNERIVKIRELERLLSEAEKESRKHEKMEEHYHELWVERKHQAEDLKKKLAGVEAHITKKNWFTEMNKKSLEEELEQREYPVTVTFEMLIELAEWLASLKVMVENKKDFSFKEPATLEEVDLIAFHPTTRVSRLSEIDQEEKEKTKQ